MRRLFCIWTFGAVTGVILTYELLWNQATATVAREYANHKAGRH